MASAVSPISQINNLFTKKCVKDIIRVSRDMVAQLDSLERDMTKNNGPNHMVVALNNGCPFELT